MDRLTAAKVFVETVARGSISAAATHLDMSRAMASRYIDLMEQWAESRLLHRTTRRLSLTSTGEELLPVCREMLKLSQDVSALGARAETTPMGLLRITASSIFAEYCLTGLLMEFLAEHPAVSIDLQVVDRITNLAEDGIDLAIRVTNNLDPGVIARKLSSVQSIVCASPAYLQQHGTPQDVKQLSAHNCLTYAYFGKSVWHFARKGETISVPVSGNFSTNEAAVVVRAALRGAGVAMLPKFAAAEALAQGALIQLVPEFEVESLGVHAVYLSRRHMPCALHALIDYLGEALPAFEAATGPHSAVARPLPSRPRKTVRNPPR